MAQFYFKQYPEHGWCLSCMSSTNDRGFVDFIGTTTFRENDNSMVISGIADVYLCADCMEQSAKLVGCVTQAEVEELSYKEAAKEEEITKLKDEVQSWQSRFEEMITQVAGIDWQELLTKEKANVDLPDDSK